MKFDHFKDVTPKKKMKSVNESADPTVDDIKKFFDINGDISITPEGIDVDGDVYSLEKKKLPNGVVPFKFNVVRGTFDMQDYYDLKSLENFPNKARTINISFNKGLADLTGGENITCEKFEAESAALQSLQGCPTAVHYDFTGCEKLTSSDGIPTTAIQSIQLKDCPNVTSVGNLIDSMPRDFTDKSLLSWNPNLPLVGIVLYMGAPNRLKFSLGLNGGGSRQQMAALEKVLTEYRGRGLSVAMELIRALRDAGFSGNAKFR